MMYVIDGMFIILFNYYIEITNRKEKTNKKVHFTIIVLVTKKGYG